MMEAVASLALLCWTGLPSVSPWGLSDAHQAGGPGRAGEEQSTHLGWWDTLKSNLPWGCRRSTRPGIQQI